MPTDCRKEKPHYDIYALDIHHCFGPVRAEYHHCRGQQGIENHRRHEAALEFEHHIAPVVAHKSTPGEEYECFEELGEVAEAGYMRRPYECSRRKDCHGRTRGLAVEGVDSR